MSSSWLGSGRQEQLDKAVVWTIVFNEPSASSKSVKKYAVWGIPDTVVQEFGALVTSAKNILDMAKNEGTRNKVVDKQVAAAFKTLTAKMREIKKKYFYIPPLTEPDFAALKLKVPEKRTRITRDPDALVSLLLSIKDAYNRLLGEIIVVAGDLNERHNQGILHIVYGIFDANAQAPTDPKQLTEHLLTKRRRETFNFPYDSSGKMAYFCVRIESGERKGQWGPVAGAKIP